MPFTRTNYERTESKEEKTSTTTTTSSFALVDDQNDSLVSVEYAIKTQLYQTILDWRLPTSEFIAMRDWGNHQGRGDRHRRKQRIQASKAFNWTQHLTDYFAQTEFQAWLRQITAREAKSQLKIDPDHPREENADDVDAFRDQFERTHLHSRRNHGIQVT